MTPLVITVTSIALITVLSAVYCAVFAGRLPVVPRFLASLTFACLSIFSACGYLASYEPGTVFGWKASYGLLTVLCAIVAGRLWLVRPVQKPEY